MDLEKNIIFATKIKNNAMNLTISKKDGETLAVVEGRLDTVNAPVFEKMMQPLLQEDASNIVMDCSDLEYIASSGLRLFLVLQKSLLKRKTSLTIIGLRKEVKTVFDMTGFSKIFTIK